MDSTIIECADCSQLLRVPIGSKFVACPTCSSNIALEFVQTDAKGVMFTRGFFFGLGFPLAMILVSMMIASTGDSQDFDTLNILLLIPFATAVILLAISATQSRVSGESQQRNVHVDIRKGAWISLVLTLAFYFLMSTALMVGRAGIR
mgnify:FL=1|tara:strand:+ start:2046 stop:2489 length:444 start_codon:yes stop_codon:yes gene_type:complete